ncbi:MAG: CO/xanthine dehydrogenase Mo-binding subunit [Candidatus Azotimanducaceae bacterium]|jgi:CO/xanthine dehydrogenase Mo-binding subunit
MSKLKHLQKNQSPKISRRGFMIGATSAGFTLAFVPAALLNSNAARAMSASEFEPTVWYSIQPNGAITVNIAEAEMGQHVGTALARIVAEELEANWDDISLKYVDSQAKYGYRVTGGSWSIWQNFDLLSRAGAAGRQALMEEGAKLLGVSKAQCSAAKSRVVCGSKSISYGEIVARGDLTRRYSEDELASMPIKKAADRQLIGVETAALDIPDKTRGKAVYGIDATVEGMVYGKPVLPPTRYDSIVTSVDDTGAKNVPGYQQTLILKDPSGIVPGWAMVIADSYHAASKAAARIKVNYDNGPAAKVSEADIQAHAVELIKTDQGALVVEDAGVDSAFANAGNIIERQYTTATALHFQMEPVNALALQRDGIWELHTGNQWQSLALPWYAKALGVPEEKILMKTYLLGGGFGRRLNGDYGVPALLAAQALGKPVKVVFSREDDSRFDSVRSPSVQKLQMALDDKNQIVGMQHHAAAGWPTAVMADFFLGTGTNGEKFDPFAISGANHWYSVGAHRVRAISNDLANRTFRPGWLRSVGPGWTNWASESFMDEVAYELGEDPVQFRLARLKPEGKNAGSSPNAVGGAARLANVLKRAASKSGWGKPLPKNQGMGVATTFGQERDMPTWTACVAEVHVDPASGQVKVEKLTLVLDAGTVVHPDGALAQTEGAALWGLSLALYEGTEFKQGEISHPNLDTYTPLRMSDVPELDIELVKSDLQSVGLGEPATTVVGPAIANAVFAAVGARVRHLPMRPEDILAAIS